MSRSDFFRMQNGRGTERPSIGFVHCISRILFAALAAGALAGCASAPAVPPLAAVAEPAPEPAPVAASEKVNDMVQKARALAFAPKEGAATHDPVQDRIDVAMLAMRANPAATQRAEIATKLDSKGDQLSPDEVRARIDGLAQHSASNGDEPAAGLSHEDTMRRLRELSEIAARQRAAESNRKAFGELKPFPAAPEGPQTASVQP